MNEPQSVTDLMAEIRARWARECDACDGETRDARRALHGRLCALADEYPAADYPRREDIEKELRGLMDRHRTLPPLDLPDDDVDVPDDDVALGAEASTARAEAEPAPRPAPRLYTELDPLTDEPFGGPAWPAPEAGAAPNAAPEANAAPNAGAGPYRSPRFESGADERGDFGPEPSRGAVGGIGERVGNWFRWAYHELDYQALARKREARLAELGGRVQELAAAGRLASVVDDEGVRYMLSQVAQVDEAIAEHRARCTE